MSRFFHTIVLVTKDAKTANNWNAHKRKVTSCQRRPKQQPNSMAQAPAGSDNECLRHGGQDKNSRWAGSRFGYILLVFTIMPSKLELGIKNVCQK